MDKKLIYESQNEHPGYGAGSGTTELYEYECPCGKGKIIEEHDNIPGFREHDVYIDCEVCSKLFDINTNNGTRNWKLDGFLISGLTKSKLRLDESVKNQNVKDVLTNLFEFLSWIFAIREKCKIKKETNQKFFALKDVLDLIKHDYDLIKLNFLAIKTEPSYQYPYQYPRKYESKVKFGNIDDLKDIGEERLSRYKNNIENNIVSNLANEIFEDTIKVYNKL